MITLILVYILMFKCYGKYLEQLLALKLVGHVKNTHHKNQMKYFFPKNIFQ